MALVLGGVALGAMGVLRLSRAGFTAMPLWVALATMVIGLGVAGFGLVLRSLEPSTPVAEPRIELDPVDSVRGAPSEEITGVVRMRDGTPAARVEVELVPLFGGEDAKTARTSTGPDGAFTFPGVNVTPGTPYIVDAHFDGATFASDVLRSGRDEHNPMRVVVAPSTKKTKALSLDVESIAIVGDADGLQAVHALTVRNGGRRAFVGGLRLPLLPNATAINPGAGLDRRRLTIERGQLLSRSPVLPGKTNITYTYLMPTPTSGINFSRSVAYPTRRFELLVGGQLRTDTGSGLRAAGKVTLGPQDRARTYQRFRATGLAPSDDVTFGLHVARDGPWPYVGIGAAVLVALGLLAYPLVRTIRRRPGAAPDVELTAQTP